MKTNRSRSKNSATITTSRWLAYATAGATSAFAAANSADGAIHYSGLINEWIGHYHHEEFRLDQKGDSFGLKHYQIWSGGYGGTARFGMFGLAGAAFAGVYHSCSGNNTQAAFVSNLKRGQLISNQRFLGRQSGLVWASWAFECGTGGFSYNGQFVDDQTGYIGFKFNNGSGDQYGWARIAMKGDDHAVKLIDYAYGDVGDRVKVGQTRTNDMVPDKGSLAALALGAAGLVAWRKNRSRATG
jgi:hypothetical protein